MISTIPTGQSNPVLASSVLPIISNQWAGGSIPSALTILLSDLPDRGSGLNFRVLAAASNPHMAQCRRAQRNDWEA